MEEQRRDTIVIIEDDDAIVMGLEFALQQEGYRTAVCRSLKEGLALLHAEAFARVQLVLLDVGLPDGSGYELCKAVKKERNLPVIFLTACDAEVNVVMGLDIGGDDYVTKPFRLRELLSRIRSVLRRYEAMAKETGGGDGRRQKASVVCWQHLRLYPEQMKVVRIDEAAEREVSLTALEYRLLLMLARHRGQVLTRNQLLESIWDVAGDFVSDNAVSVYIKRLREKLEKDPQHPQLIETVRGVGYRAGEGWFHVE